VKLRASKNILTPPRGSTYILCIIPEKMSLMSLHKRFCSEFRSFKIHWRSPKQNFKKRASN